MTNRARHRASDRAEARRRARYAALGRAGPLTDSSYDQETPEGTPNARQEGGTFLTRLFPPAPPLRGMPDPLAGFSYDGPLRGVVGGLYLLGVHPVPWLGMAAVWAVGRTMLAFSPVVGILGILASLVAFGSLIAAGWLGWPRPWLFGLAAAVAGIIIYAGISAALISGAPAADVSAGEAFAGSMYSEVLGFQPLFGALAGWYGGYLRRRMAATGTAATGRRRARS